MTPSRILAALPFPAAAPWLQQTSEAITAKTPFSEASDIWLTSLCGTEIHRLRKTTESGYRAGIATLKIFFRDIPLGDIRLDHIKRYEEKRVAGADPFIRFRRPHDAYPRKLKDGTVVPAKGKTPCPANPKKANQEISVLKRILRAAKLWGEEEQQCYQPMVEPESDTQRALSPKEQAHWLKIASSSARWHLVYYYSELAFATCTSTNEIRSLRLCDINLEAGTINIPWAGSKNRYRHRGVEIGQPGDRSWHAVEWLLARGASLGATQPHHHLFPFRDGTFDPTRPMTISGIKTLWNEVRDASGLKWFRPYDTRHTAITRYAESGVPLAVIMDMAGHINPKMTRHYTHISGGQKREAMRQVQTQQQGGRPAPVLASSPIPSIHVASVAASARPTPVIPLRTNAVKAELTLADALLQLVQEEIARQVAIALQRPISQ